MIIKTRHHGYSSQRKYIQGEGFVDSLTSSLRGVGSYVAQNKDLIAKPLLGAVGNLAASGLAEGGKALLSYILNKNTSKKSLQANHIESTQLDPKSMEIIQTIRNGGAPPVTNIIGSGACGAAIGSGIKRF